MQYARLIIILIITTAKINKRNDKYNNIYICLKFIIIPRAVAPVSAVLAITSPRLLL